ncbi:hypothetical protein [Epilithonimonas caeni]|uniref:hypothetical protein n=1 Tax=Epilithonimonas caeni TaxID=365343 RepID=UPI00041D9409|nr:hypothetical protein [Epilithonimonas caeni]
MKKFYYYLLIIPTIIFSLIYSCERDKAVDASSNKTNNIFSKSAKYKDRTDNYLFTKGGSVEFSVDKINNIYKSVTKKSDNGNVLQFMLFTTGNLSNGNDFDYSKIEGVCFYKLEDGFLVQNMFKKSGDNFVEIPELSLKISSIHMTDVNFLIKYSKLPTYQLTTYLVKNEKFANKSVSEYNESEDFQDFISYYVGSQVKLDNTLSQEETIEILGLLPGGGCKGCGNSRGVCDYDGPIGVYCDVNGCSSGYAKNQLISNNSEYANNFNDAKSYSIRDNVLENSLFGLKYENYYYQTSFSELNISFSDAIEYAKILPDLYIAYDNIVNGNSEEILISDVLAQKINNILNNLISSNSDKENFIKILQDIKSDVSYLKNKTIEEVNDKIY